MKVTVVVMMNFTCIACDQINIKEGFVCSAMNNAKLTNLHIKGKMDGPFLLEKKVVHIRKYYSDDFLGAFQCIS